MRLLVPLASIRADKKREGGGMPTCCALRVVFIALLLHLALSNKHQVMDQQRYNPTH